VKTEAVTVTVLFVTVIEMVLLREI